MPNKLDAKLEEERAIEIKRLSLSWPRSGQRAQLFTRYQTQIVKVPMWEVFAELFALPNSNE